ncbi:hypothetical protein SARC_13496 [Sphaeroforma arctica JP610]|uniref:Uncharacterized protein n=1 Tax=Sphaeroforma arctica JP610 TaxID=667725 RepID=A0A0L0FCZ5_9EUKA|nr:hypothetical protein SARC_13496 [Sphaeroforma arctica JP610]KNC73948.1 hypothetical protein SARC_13496 [Sphaeroforma arctica JP610]|eukprot:XP_014147850.1 hypothetical protein SARC_13496 [Sphaeroforma arctica JP610]
MSRYVPTPYNYGAQWLDTILSPRTLIGAGKIRRNKHGLQNKGHTSCLRFISNYLESATKTNTLTQSIRHRQLRWYRVQRGYAPEAAQVSDQQRPSRKEEFLDMVIGGQTQRQCAPIQLFGSKAS